MPVHSPIAMRHALPAAVSVPCAWVNPTALSLGFFIQPFTAVGHR
ncbi:hypothetical protein [Aquitalea sp. USM4]|nr:hypothetical protein [Aquitalea sp. USM4]